MRYVLTCLICLLIVMPDCVCAQSDPLPEQPMTYEERARRATLAYKAQAGAGKLKGQFAYAKALERGTGTEQNYQEAAKWYLKSAQQGYDLAMSSLGTLYKKGKGVPQDKVQAYKWWRIADLTGGYVIQRRVRKELASIRQELTAEQIRQGEALAQDWIAAHPDRKFKPRNPLPPEEHDVSSRP